MKRKIFLSAVCITLTVIDLQAQSKKEVAPPPPPPPPPPVTMIAPPPPPPPAKAGKVHFTPPRIVKDGIDFKILDNNGKSIVEVYKNKKKIDRVKMATWKANRKSEKFEKISKKKVKRCGNEGYGI